MPFQLPQALGTFDDKPALRLLQRYYGERPAPTDSAVDAAVGAAENAAVGAAFDGWDSTGTRAADSDRFTADDLVAVSFLSVSVPPNATVAILRDRADEFGALLAALGPDRDLVDEEAPLTDAGWPGWRLQAELRGIPGINTTIATKLIARKRPRLRPIWDKVVAEVTGTHKHQWEPLRVALREHDRALHRRLTYLHEEARLPAAVAPLRVLDVIAWREGKDRGL